MVSRIKELCKRRNMTIAELETRAGISKNSIFRWDKNKPDYTKVVAVARVLEVSVDALVR